MVRKRISLTAKSGEAPTQGAHGRPSDNRGGAQPQGAQRGGRPGGNAPQPAKAPEQKFSNNPFAKLLRK
jgi:hypothetical protein